MAREYGTKQAEHVEVQHGTASKHLAAQHEVFALGQHVTAVDCLVGIEVLQHHIHVHDGLIGFRPNSRDGALHALLIVVVVDQRTAILGVAGFVGLVHLVALTENIDKLIREVLAVERRIAHLIVDAVHRRINATLGGKLLFFALLVLWRVVQPIGAAAHQQQCGSGERCV